MLIARRKWLMALMTLMLMAVAPARPVAAGRFPFNGDWQLDLRASQGVPPMMQGHQTRIHLQEDARRFVVTFRFDGRVMNVSTFLLDGRPHELPMFGERAESVATRLDQGRVIHLRIRRKSSGGQSSIENITFTLSPDGQTIRRVSELTGGVARSPQIYLYRRLRPKVQPVHL